MRDTRLIVLGFLAVMIAFIAAFRRILTAHRPNQMASSIDPRNRKRIAVGVGVGSMVFAVAASIVLAQVLPEVRGLLLALAALFLLIGMTFLIRMSRPSK